MKPNLMIGNCGRLGSGAAIAIGVCAAVAAGAVVSPAPAMADVQSAWVDGLSSRTRLIAGAIPAAGPQTAGRLVAGIHIVMPDGWKTYWRTPGDAGGIPPEFDFSRSQNVKSATVLFPAPQRLTDKSGDVIGYADEVVFPVSVTPADPAKPVTLALTANYGVCKNICVPVEAEVQLEVPIASGEPDSVLMAFLNRVPKTEAQYKTAEPALKHWHVDAASPKQGITIDIAGGGASADAFLEAVDGSYVPQGLIGMRETGLARLTVDLSGGTDIASLKGKTIRVTIVGDTGSVEALRPFE